MEEIKQTREEQIIHELWFHLTIIDELFTELPTKAYSYVAKASKKGNRSKEEIQYKIKSILRDTKHIHEVNLYHGEAEEVVQQIAWVKEFVRDLFLKKTALEQFQTANLMSAFFNGNLTPKLLKEIKEMK